MRAAGTSREQLVTDVGTRRNGIQQAEHNGDSRCDLSRPIGIFINQPPVRGVFEHPDAVANLVCDRVGHPSAIHVVVEDINFHGTQL